MLIIPIKEGEDNIDKILKKYKRKVERAGVLRKLKKRKFFVKKSIQLRVQKQHAVYVQQLKAKEAFNN